MNNKIFLFSTILFIHLSYSLLAMDGMPHKTYNPAYTYGKNSTKIYGKKNKENELAYLKLLKEKIKKLNKETKISQFYAGDNNSSSDSRVKIEGNLKEVKLYSSSDCSDFFDLAAHGQLEKMKKMYSENPRIALNGAVWHCVAKDFGINLLPLDIAIINRQYHVAQWLSSLGAMSLARFRGTVKYDLDKSITYFRLAKYNNLNAMLSFSSKEHNNKNNKIDVNFFKGDKTALDWAIQHKNKEMVILLLKQGANLRYNPGFIASYRGRESLASLYPDLCRLMKPISDDANIMPHWTQLVKHDDSLFFQFDYEKSLEFYKASRDFTGFNMEKLYAENPTIGVNLAVLEKDYNLSEVRLDRPYKSGETYFTALDFTKISSVSEWLKSIGARNARPLRPCNPDFTPSDLNINGRQSSIVYWEMARDNELSEMRRFYDLHKNLRNNLLDVNFIIAKKTPLDFAVLYKNKEMAEELLKYNAKLCLCTPEKFRSRFPELWKLTPLGREQPKEENNNNPSELKALAQDTPKKSIEFTRKMGLFKKRARDNEILSEQSKSIDYWNFAKANRLFKMRQHYKKYPGIDVNLVIDNKNPLDFAIWYKNKGMAEELIKHGARLNLYTPEYLNRRFPNLYNTPIPQPLSAPPKQLQPEKKIENKSTHEDIQALENQRDFLLIKQNKLSLKIDKLKTALKAQAQECQKLWYKNKEMLGKLPKYNPESNLYTSEYSEKYLPELQEYTLDTENTTSKDKAFLENQRNSLLIKCDKLSEEKEQLNSELNTQNQEYHKLMQDNISISDYIFKLDAKNSTNKDAKNLKYKKYNYDKIVKKIDTSEEPDEALNEIESSFVAFSDLYVKLYAKDVNQDELDNFKNALLAKSYELRCKMPKDLAVELWISGVEEEEKLRGKEFCFMLNDGLRKDDPELITAALAIIRALNYTEQLQPIKWPTKLYRGAAIPDKVLSSLKAGHKYRYQGYLAFSSSELIADNFSKISLSNKDRSNQNLVPIKYIINCENIADREPFFEPCHCFQIRTSQEEEFLFLPHSVFIIISINTKVSPSEVFINAVPYDSHHSKYLPRMEWH